MSPVVASQRSKRCNIEEETLMPSMKTTRHYTKEGARHGANNLQLSYIAWSKLFENRTIKEATLKTRTAEPTASKHRRRSMPPRGILLRSRSRGTSRQTPNPKPRKKKRMRQSRETIYDTIWNQSIQEATGKTRLHLQSMTKQENIDAS